MFLLVNEINKEIENVFYQYVKVQSNTGTQNEREAETFLLNYIKNMDYFKDNSGYYGCYKIKDDPLCRGVVWALVKGTGNDTVVFVHHNDVVDIEDFKLLKPLAYSPEELQRELFKMKNSLSEEVQEDLESQQFVFGRGTADMRAGGAIQLALIREYSERYDIKGNVLLISVPDEENLSAGMRGAVKLLDELKSKYMLDYKLMINSEPHQRKEKDIGVLSEGSVGKLMPFVYVRGYLAHAGKVFEGFNPVNLFSEIVRRTELNTDFSDFVNGEASPPPTWLYMKDSKQCYDVSMPLSAYGCLSILTLNKSPEKLLELLHRSCSAAFEKIIEDMNKSYHKFNEGMGKDSKKLPWESKVTTFKALYDEALEKYGQEFEKHYESKLKQAQGEINLGRMTMLSGTLNLIEEIYNYVDDLSPRVVIGLVPPYYPNVSNIYFNSISSNVEKLSKELTDYSKTNFAQDYHVEHFYTGISDLSYTSIQNGDQMIKTLKEEMPLFEKLYTIPIACIERISMPCMNIGPWGKDFHKLTERVLREDMLFRTPALINHAVSFMLDW